MSSDSRSKTFKAFNDSIKELMIEFIVAPETSMIDIGRYNEEICPPIMRSGLNRYTFVEKNYTNQVERREAWDKVLLMNRHTSGTAYRKPVEIDMDSTDFIAENISDDKKGKYDYVTCFDGFQLMTGFNDRHKAARLIRNVADALKPGGIFFGSVMDSAIIFSGIDRSSGKGSMATDIYRIDMSSSSFKEFGTSIEFTLNGSGDFFGSLVHFPTLINLCREYRLKMLDIQNFEEFYNDYKSSVDKKIMYRGCKVRSDQLKPFRLYTTFVFKKF